MKRNVYILLAAALCLLLGSHSIVGAGVMFTENRGQWDDKVLYKAEGTGGLTWWIDGDGVPLPH